MISCDPLMILYELLFYDNSVILLFLSTSLLSRHLKMLSLKLFRLIPLLPAVSSHLLEEQSTIFTHEVCFMLLESTDPGSENSCVMSSVTVARAFQM